MYQNQIIVERVRCKLINFLITTKFRPVFQVPRGRGSVGTRHNGEEENVEERQQALSQHSGGPILHILPSLVGHIQRQWSKPPTTGEGS